MTLLFKQLTIQMLLTLLLLFPGEVSLVLADEINSFINAKAPVTKLEEIQKYLSKIKIKIKDYLLQPTLNSQGVGLRYKDTVNSMLVNINPEYSKQSGAYLSGSLSGPLSKNIAIGTLFTAGSKKKEWLVNAGYYITDHQSLVLSFGQLQQKLNFGFISGTEQAHATQDSIGLSYRYFLGKDWLNSAEVGAYMSNTGSINLDDKTYSTNTTSLYELWNDPRQISGGQIEGVQSNLVIKPDEKNTIKVGLGIERLTYDFFTGDISTNRATKNVDWVKQLVDDFNFHASTNVAASQSRYALGLSKSFDNGAQLGCDVVKIKGRDNTFDDNQFSCSFSLKMVANNTNTFMSSATTTDVTTNSKNDSRINSLVQSVSRRPNFIPSQIIAKVDNTATSTRLIAIDKTSINGTIDLVTGVITASVSTAVSSIASVTLNGSAFTNTGQFTLSSSSGLLVNPNLINQPSPGVTDTYVVRMNNVAGGGTTLATVTVDYGSTRISSIVISSGTIVTTISAFIISSSTVQVGDTPPTITTPTSDSSGAITYTSSNTSVISVTSSGTITIVGAGTSVLTRNQAANGDYTASTSTITITVNAASTTILTVGSLSLVQFTNELKSWTDANAYCSTATINGITGWRMPSSSELITFWNAYGNTRGSANALSGYAFIVSYTWNNYQTSPGYHQWTNMDTGRQIGLPHPDSDPLYWTCVK